MKTQFSAKGAMRAGAMVAAALSLAACATMDSGTPEQIVTKRAQAYWDARLKGDASTAYGFANDAFKQAVDEQKFKRGTWLLLLLALRCKRWNAMRKNATLVSI